MGLFELESSFEFRDSSLRRLSMRFDEFFVKDGRFVADDVTLEEIAKQQTPLYVYSAQAIRTKYRQLHDHFRDFGICYSLKANPNLAVCEVLVRAGAGAEVSSAAELATALAAGFARDNIIYVAPVKTATDIERALLSGIHAVVADSVQEMETIEQQAARLGRTARVLLRINTSEQQPEAKEVMVGGPSKFGFDEERVVAELGGLKLEHARIAGIQVYSASQVLDLVWLETHIEYVLRLARQLSGEIGFSLETVDFGGGFGVPQHDGDPDLDLAGLAGAVAESLNGFRTEYPNCRLLFESGRFLVAEAGVFVTRVFRVKESRGRVFAICDGGMNAFSRPVFMHIKHEARLLNRLGEPATAQVDVCGPICTPLDCIAKQVSLPMPRSGDLVGFLNAGAYGCTMSLVDFMSRGRPAELMADGGELRRA
ncbi:diaminopimelate decarboxylase [candidate division WOR-3 bacterium]|uniref:Diaminopimelate decarboxylase n=1 Tax=candidate division WOR-3 bacterium TaxID=2052148 RepID=A0A937XCL9_UNCW3|nr:diaminopimelate decarboxylase [candidate division WOR-3 bacterium]